MKYMYFTKPFLIFFLVLLSSLTLLAQQKTVAGKVINQQTNEPIQGATVNVKGTDRSTITGADGSFSISVPNAKAVLVVSYVGFASQEIGVAKPGPYTVAMASGTNQLDEVVVIGYGATKRRDLTGAITTVKPEEITARPGPNPMESLQGRVAGLDITRTSGEPGAGINIQLRGTRSITASGNPLFIINGLPGDYATLNPYDIESIEVLKDASSTAVYGSAGANGVIIITTKGGKAGKLNIDFNTYYGYNGWSITPKMLTKDQYLQAKRDAYKWVYDLPNNKWTTTGAQWQSPADDSTIFGNRWTAFKNGDFINWADVFLRKNAATQNYSLSVSGGNEATKGYISANYTDEKGQYTGDQYRLFTTSMRIDHRVRKWISMGANLQASYVDRGRARDKLENALVTDPVVQPYNPDGTLNTNLGNNTYNLLLDYQPGVYENRDNNTRLFFNPYVEIRPLKGLTFLSRAGAHMDYSNNYLFNGVGSVGYQYLTPGVTNAQITQNRYQGYQWENILTYNFKLANVHDFTFTGVSSWYYNQNTLTQMSQTGVNSNNFKWYNFTGDSTTKATSSYNMTKTIGYIARLNYSYLGKYLFSASIRRDGSSVLYPTHRWNNFPAASVGWRISDEKFMDATRTWLNSMKLRVGWGISGTAGINAYTSQNALIGTTMSLGGVTQTTYRNSQYITNPDLTWEKSHNTNIGLDVTAFKNRIDLSLDYYITHTPGVIYSVTAPITAGDYTPGVNYLTNINTAETKNKGFEVSLNTRNVTTKSFEWTTSATFSKYNEAIVNLVGGTANNLIPSGSPYTLSIGYPVNSFRNYKLDGIWQIGEEADALVFGRRPGDIKVNVPGMERLQAGVFVKTAADGTKTYYYTSLSEVQKYNSALTAAKNTYNYSSTDYQILGHNSPNWTLGFQNSFKYKGFDLTVYAYLRWGQMINYVMPGWYQPQALATTASPSRTFPGYFNYWTPDNPSNDFPVMNYSSTSNLAGFSGLTYVDGSFFKIKNISLGYTLPANISKRASIQKLRVYGTMTNPLIVAKSHLIKNYDPEMNGSLDYPLTRQIVVGLNVTF
jgi:TonB-linked SusC/RagA family outer membrane protein